MSQLVKRIEAWQSGAYLFRIALDRIPDPDEKKQMKDSIRDAMEGLGVPREQVAVTIFKSDIPPEVSTPQDEEEIHPRRGYLLCILVRSEPGVLQQDHDEIMEEEVNGFIQYAGIDAGQVAAVVLENAFLEVQQRSTGPGVFI